MGIKDENHSGKKYNKQDFYSMDELIEKSGLSRRTIRFYVQEGLIVPPIGRGLKGLYSKETLDRLNKIKEMQRNSIELKAIKRLLSNTNNDNNKIKPVQETPISPRSIAVRYRIACGIELIVDKEFDINNSKKIAEVVSTLEYLLRGDKENNKNKNSKCKKNSDNNYNNII
jgi:DNA-binding transcriptional MerR regulator